MDRGELEDLDRESLVVRAQAAGIRRARILTRPELIDELLRLDPNADAAQLKKSRGFFGRARDLVARVVERGLHLPDAADRIRTMALGTTIPTTAVPRTEPQAMPTVTLAEIYAAQGHRQRAIETLRRVLEREPDHAAAQALLARLEDDAYVTPKPRLAPEPEVEPELDAGDDEESDEEESDEEESHEDGPGALLAAAIKGPTDGNGEYEFSLLPASELEPRADSDDSVDTETREVPRVAGDPDAFADVDAHAKTDVFAVIPEKELPEVEECFAIPVAREGGGEGAGARMFVRWSISWSTLGALLGARPNGRFVVRAHVLTPAWDGPNAETRDLIVDPSAEQVMLVGLPEPSVVRVAVGWLDGATFVPVAHSPALETPRGRGLVIWTTNGPIPVVLDDPHDPRAASIARALAASQVATQAHA